MHPVLVDLTQFEPFGISMASPIAKGIALLVIVIVGHLLAKGLVRSGVSEPGRYSRLIRILCGVGLALVVAVLIWIVGKVHSYGLMMALGFITAMTVTRWRLRRCGEDPDLVGVLGMFALVGGVVGARISYIVQHWDTFGATHVNGVRRGVIDQVVEMFKLSSGGLVFDGGLMLAIVLVIGLLLVKRLPVRRILDVLAVSAVVGLAFGRMGCLLNGCCYGGVCDVDYPLGIRFPYAATPMIYPHDGENPYPPDAHVSSVYTHQFVQGDAASIPDELLISDDDVARLKMPNMLTRKAEYEVAQSTWSLPVHPAQVYGIVNALVLAALLCAVFRLRTREGQVFAWLLILYPITRFMLEIIRDDSPGMALTPAQRKCLFLTSVGLVVLGLLRLLPASCGPGAAERAAATVNAPPADNDRKRPRHKKRPGRGST